MIVTVRSNKDLESFEKKIKEKNLKMFPILLDVTNETQVIESVPRVEQYLKKNNLEFVSLINNAGKIFFLFFFIFFYFFFYFFYFFCFFYYLGLYYLSPIENVDITEAKVSKKISKIKQNK